MFKSPSTPEKNGRQGVVKLLHGHIEQSDGSRIGKVPLNSAADDLARAMREDYYTDPQGRRVRAKYAARFSSGDKQLTLWADIRSDPPEHRGVAFQQRRQQVVGDCKQLKTDVESYNDNNPMGAFIQMSFNFEMDLEEIELTDGSSLRIKKPR